MIYEFRCCYFVLFRFLSFLLFHEYCASSILVKYKIHINYNLKGNILDSIIKMKKNTRVFIVTRIIHHQNLCVCVKRKKNYNKKK